MFDTTRTKTMHQDQSIYTPVASPRDMSRRVSPPIFCAMMSPNTNPMKLVPVMTERRDLVSSATP